MQYLHSAHHCNPLCVPGVTLASETVNFVVFIQMCAHFIVIEWPRVLTATARITTEKGIEVNANYFPTHTHRP